MNRKELIQYLKGTSDEDFIQVSADALAIQTKECERLTISLETLLARNELLEKAFHPGKQSCDCCIREHYKGESFWAIDCQCGNHDDIGRAQAWCSMANSYEGVTGKSAIAAVEAQDESEQRKIWGELYLDDEGKAHFDCHIHSSVKFGEAEAALIKFIWLLQEQIDRKAECPLHIREKQG